MKDHGISYNSLPMHTFNVPGSTNTFHSPAAAVTSVDILVIGGGSNSKAGSLVLYMDYLLQPDTPFTVKVGEAGQDSSISLPNAGLLFVAQGGASSSSDSRQNIVNGAKGMGPIIQPNFAVASSSVGMEGITSIKLASNKFGTVDICKEFGSICDEDLPLVAAVSSTNNAVNGTGSAAGGLLGKGASGIVIIKQRKLYPGTKASYEACYNDCLGPEIRITYSTPQEFIMDRDILLDLLLISAGQNSSALFVRDAFFPTGRYSAMVGYPGQGQNQASFISRLSNNGENMFAVDSNGIVSASSAASSTTTGITENDYLLIERTSSLPEGGTVQDVDSRSTLTLCSYFAFALDFRCRLGDPTVVGNVAIRRASSLTSTCRSRCLAMMQNSNAQLSLCPAGKQQQHQQSSLFSCRACGNNTYRDLASQLEQTCTECMDGFVTVKTEQDRSRQGSRHSSSCKNWCTYSRRRANFSVTSRSNSTTSASSGIAYDEGIGYHWYSFASSASSSLQYTMVLSRMVYADVFMIAGGGGGGILYGGGGGAGAHFAAYTMSLLPGTYIIQVGAGGGSAQAGQDTIIWHEDKPFLHVRGGSPGGIYQSAPPDGGCGGGSPAARSDYFSRAFNNGTNGTCFDGGRGMAVTNGSGAGGGGGIGGAGENGVLVQRVDGFQTITTRLGGSGGRAIEINLRGNTETFGGGGGGYGIESLGGKVITKVGGDGGYKATVGGVPTNFPGQDAIADTGSGM